MPAWGVKGGGPHTDQQLDTVIEYLWSVQLTPEEMHKQVDDAVKRLDEGSTTGCWRSATANEDVADPAGDDFDPPRSRRTNCMLGEILFYLDDATDRHQQLLVRPLPRARRVVRQAVGARRRDRPRALRPEPRRHREHADREAALPPGA